MVDDEAEYAAEAFGEGWSCDVPNSLYTSILSIIMRVKNGLYSPVCTKPGSTAAVAIGIPSLSNLACSPTAKSAFITFEKPYRPRGGDISSLCLSLKSSRFRKCKRPKRKVGFLTALDASCIWRWTRTWWIERCGVKYERWTYVDDTNIGVRLRGCSCQEWEERQGEDEGTEVTTWVGCYG